MIRSTAEPGRAPVFLWRPFMPTFSIIIPVKPSGAIKALEALRRLPTDEYPFEVFVAEGTMPSRQRNLAARQAHGEIIYFLDDDSLVTDANLPRCAAVVRDSSVAVAGGPSLTPPSDSFLQRLFGFALSSPFGAGAMRNRYRAVGTARETTEQELILCNLAVRRDIFLEAGGFDERLYPNEENELLDRINSAHRLVHDPGMAVWRSQRSTLRAFMRQMFSYGRGRAQQTLLAGPRSLMSFLPLLFVFYLVVVPFLSDFWVWRFPLALYGLAALFSAVAAAFGSGKPGAAAVLLIFPIMHICNGLGLLKGFVCGKPVVATDDTVVVIRKLKSFEDQTW
ncbi:glycosyltransferase family 2 protein [Geobacter sp. SVR]|uniref:glycosyltransferase family 2 protein n=1 Tax=Geobacter sp. SVR TaxID=2495594 RepID=UPI00143EF80C|nr:glycosyltransferase family 2 protein [Geobacter sp. SVR]BCS55092.1 glycosyl transferase family 2 [Geobacter sp. SVR]GCF85273.1 glycosyl transferase family 2 [Geobacter sp. SVR]